MLQQGPIVVVFKSNLLVLEDSLIHLRSNPNDTQLLHFIGWLGGRGDFMTGNAELRSILRNVGPDSACVRISNLDRNFQEVEIEVCRNDCALLMQLASIAPLLIKCDPSVRYEFADFLHGLPPAIEHGISDRRGFYEIYLKDFLFKNIGIIGHNKVEAAMRWAGIA